MVIDLEDQENMLKEEALAAGVPNIRYIHASRTLPGPEDVDRIFESVIEGLTRPLTKKEQEKGHWEPQQPRVLFEGTLDEAQTFYQQTEYIPSPVNAPICVYSDGYPIIVPTEERVQEMLKGTSHKPDELITYQADRIERSSNRPQTDSMPAMVAQVEKGDLVVFRPRNWPATVEQVAVNAVMAGCKPEHLPVVLAIAESGCDIGTTVFPNQAVCLSGPIVKDLGMNVGCGMFDGGNPANTTIGRAYQLMARNLGGAIQGVNRMGSMGSPLNRGGTCYAENADGLPPGWKGLNEEHGFRKDESIVWVTDGGGVQGAQFPPGTYRSLQKNGHGGIARRLGVKGTPGPHNWLEYLIPNLWATREGAFTIVMIPEMAQHLYEYGFKSKQEVYEWIRKKSFIPLKDYMLRAQPDIRTNGWMSIERTSGKHWRELPSDYMIPLVDDPFDNCIIVAGGQEEVSVQFSGGRASLLVGRSVDETLIPKPGELIDHPVYSIDAWR